MERNLRKKNGITLVALIVTIIILLILAGVAISQLTGNGLLEKAKLAKEKQENSQIKEDEKLGDYENKIEEYINGNREANKSILINDFKIKNEQNGLKAKIDIDGSISTTNNSPVLVYIFLVNGKAVDSSKKLPYNLSLNNGATDSVSVIAIDEDANMKKSSNTLTITTPKYLISALQYPILTENGIVNAKYKYSDDENDFIYALDLSVDCTAEDALDKAAYDGDESTYYRPNSKKNKFLVTDSNIDIYYICFKIDSNASGTVIKNDNANNYYSTVGDGRFIDKNCWHDIWFRTHNINFGQGTFLLMDVKVYEIFYDKTIK